MPPSGFFSRNLAMGESSPRGSRSSILVLGSVMNTTVTPCSGRASGAETSAPRVLRYTRDAAAMSRTAMATWLRRPIMAAPAFQPWPSLYLYHQHMTCGLLAPFLVHGGPDGAMDGILHRLRIAALGLGKTVEQIGHRIGHDIGHVPPVPVLLGQAHGVHHRVAGDVAAIVDGDRHCDNAGEGELAALR